MIDPPRPPVLSALLSAAREPQIVLAALARLRWLAVIGQIGAVAVAHFVLRLQLPLAPIAAIIVVTALSNLLLIGGGRSARPLVGWVRGTILLDVLLLTALLYYTGGPNNPFSSLYLVHVTMAVIVSGTAWTWVVVATAAAGYGLLLKWHVPLHGLAPLPASVSAVGSWGALVLVSVLVAAFIGRVIRALRQRETELAAVRGRVARNEQLAALTTLAAGAAHELNTPLGTIAVVAKEMELSCGTGGAGASVLEDARLIRREVDRCQGILSRLRLDVEEDAPIQTVVRIADLIPAIRDNFDARHLNQIDVRWTPDVQTVAAPPRALEQALVVLLRNALDASPPGGPVTLEIGHRDGHVRFDVRDRGPGMAEDVLRRAGEPFFTTKEPGRGMGLGLFLVHLVAERCGATFSLDSQPGEGTRCVLEIPDRGSP